MRMARIKITPELVAQTLRTGNAIPACTVKAGLPEGAVLVGVHVETGHGNFGVEGSRYLVLDFEHESFPDADTPMELFVVLHTEPPA